MVSLFRLRSIFGFEQLHSAMFQAMHLYDQPFNNLICIKLNHKISNATIAIEKSTIEPLEHFFFDNAKVSQERCILSLPVYKNEFHGQNRDPFENIG